MITATLLATLTFAPADGPEARAAAGMHALAPQGVKIWLSKERGLRRGDRVRVYVRTEADGYLVVLHAEPDGRIRVVFPLDPYDDNFLRGGREYELEGRGGREAFQVYERDGVGTVFAAFSRDPFRFDELVRNGHWDYRDRDKWVVYEDAETDLIDLAHVLAAGQPWQYDIVRYGVGSSVAYGHRRHYHLGLYPVYDPFFSGGTRFSFSAGFGYYHPYGYAASCWDPWYYDPFFCDPFFFRHRYYRTGFFYGRYYYGPYYYRPYVRTVFVYRDRAGYAYDRSLRLNRYTFKSDHGVRLADGGIGVRRRVADPAGGGRVATGDLASRVTPVQGTPVRERRPALGADGVTERRRAAPRGDARGRPPAERRPVTVPQRTPDNRGVAPPREVRPRDARPEVRPRDARPEVRQPAERRGPPAPRVTPPASAVPERRAQPARPAPSRGSVGPVRQPDTRAPRGRSSARVVTPAERGVVGAPGGRQAAPRLERRARGARGLVPRPAPRLERRPPQGNDARRFMPTQRAPTGRALPRLSVPAPRLTPRAPTPARKPARAPRRPKDG